MCEDLCQPGRTRLLTCFAASVFVQPVACLFMVWPKPLQAEGMLESVRVWVAGMGMHGQHIGAVWSTHGCSGS